MKQLFRDILKTKPNGNGLKFSQGRVYLFISLIFYFLTLILVMIRSYYNKDINLEGEQFVVDALQWIIIIFATYAFSGKGLDVLSVLAQRRTKPSTDTTTLTTTTSTTTNTEVNQPSADIANPPK